MLAFMLSRYALCIHLVVYILQIVDHDIDRNGVTEATATLLLHKNVYVYHVKIDDVKHVIYSIL